MLHRDLQATDWFAVSLEEITIACKPEWDSGVHAVYQGSFQFGLIGFRAYRLKSSRYRRLVDRSATGSCFRTVDINAMPVESLESLRHVTKKQQSGAEGLEKFFMGKRTLPERWN